jgi:hypothetical protein
MRHTRSRKKAVLMAEAEAIIETYLNWEEQASAPKLSEIEDVVLKLRHQMGQRMVEVALADQEARQPAVAPTCPRCGGEMRYKGQKETVVESRAGELNIERGHYYCAPCESGLFPPG